MSNSAAPAPRGTENSTVDLAKGRLKFQRLGDQSVQRWCFCSSDSFQLRGPIRHLLGVTVREGSALCTVPHLPEVLGKRSLDLGDLARVDMTFEHADDRGDRQFRVHGTRITQPLAN